jgi:hypothetical protein
MDNVRAAPAQVAKVALARREKMDKMVYRHDGGGTSLGNVRAGRK